MQTLDAKDVQYIIDMILLKNENLGQDIFAGSGKNKKIVVKDGLKVRHIPTGLVYTVIEYINDDSSGPAIRCSRPGKEIVIPSNEFNKYVRH
jgi:hypothetical protein